MADSSTKSDGQRLEKITGATWIVWWFLFYIIIGPFVTWAMSFYLSGYLSKNLYFAINFSVSLTVSSFPVFFKLFDRYLKNPLLKNDVNNADFRIHVPFLISAMGLIASAVVQIFTPIDYYYPYLPLILFSIVYNLTWLYLYFKPIDKIDVKEVKYLHTKLPTQLFSRLHNVVLIANYIIQIGFLVFFLNERFLWINGLILNLVFYFVILVYTGKSRKSIKALFSSGAAIERENPLPLLEFKQRFVQAEITLIFCFLFEIVLVRFLTGLETALLLAIFILTLEFLIFFKVQCYVQVRYMKLQRAEVQVYDDVTLIESNIQSIQKGQKLNSTASLVFVVVSTILPILIQNPLYVFLINGLFYLVLFFESLTNNAEEKLRNLGYLANSTVLLGYICFGLIRLPWNIQLAIFSICMYITLEILLKLKAFNKDILFLAQNVFLIASFFLFAFMFFPAILNLYTLYDFPVQYLLHAKVLMSTLIFLAALLASFYRLYFTTLKKKSSKEVRLGFVVNFLSIEGVITALVLLKNVNITDFLLVANNLLVTAIIIVSLLLVFVAINTALGIFTKKSVLLTSYYSSWVIFLLVFAIIVQNYPTFIGILWGSLYFTIILGGIIKLGTVVQQVPEEKLKTYQRLSPYFIALECFLLLFYLFSAVLRLDMLSSSYISTLIICIFSNMIYRSISFSKDFVNKFTHFTLFFTSVFIFNLIFKATIGTYNVYTLPVVVTTGFMFAPIRHGQKNQFFKGKSVYKRLLIVNSLVFTVFVLLTPTSILLDLLGEGIEFNFYVYNAWISSVWACIFLYNEHGIITKVKLFETFPAYVSKILKIGILISWICISVITPVCIYDAWQYTIIPSAAYSLSTFFHVSFSTFIFLILNFNTLHLLQKYKLCSKDMFKKYASINSYAIGISSFIFLYELFLFTALLDAFLPAFISLTIICVMSNYFRKSPLVSKGFVEKFTNFYLCFIAIMVFRLGYYWSAGTSHVYSLPVILTSTYVFIPLAHGSSKKWFGGLYAKLFFINGVVLSAFLMCIPTAILMDLAVLGFEFNLLIDLVSSAFLLYLILIIFKAILNERGILKGLQKGMHAFIIIVWFSFTVFLLIWIFMLIKPLSIGFQISGSLLLFFLLNIHTSHWIKTYDDKPSKLLGIFQFMTFYGNNISFSCLVMMFFMGIIPASIFPMNLGNFNVLWYLSIFFSVLLVHTRGLKYKLGPRSRDFAKHVEFISWFYFKVVVALTISRHLSGTAFFSNLAFFSMIFLLLTPVTTALLGEINDSFKLKLGKTRKATIYIFLVAFCWYGIETCFNFTSSFLSQGLVGFMIIFCGNLFLVASLCIEKLNSFKEIITTKQMSLIMLSLLYILIQFLLMGNILSLILLPGTFALILRVKTGSGQERALKGILLTHLSFTIVVFFQHVFVIPMVPFVSLMAHSRLYLTEYMMALVAAMIASIIANPGKNTYPEKAILDFTLSLLTYMVFSTFTPVSQFHCVTYSVITFLFLGALLLRASKDDLWCVFLKCWFLVIVFHFTNWSGSDLFFTNPLFPETNNFMVSILTYNSSVIAFIFFFRKDVAKVKKYSFTPVLLGIIITIPLFIYNLLTVYFPVPLEAPIPLLISLNIGVALFYVMIGVYNWEFSGKIWKFGWWMWNVIPLINFYIIYKIFLGIDVVDALNVFGVLDFQGSMIITILIVSLMYLPVLYSKMKKHLNTVLFFFWGESLLMIAWITQNLFGNNLLVSILCFLVIGMFLLMPLIYKMKKWGLFAKTWVVLSIINACFWYFYLVDISTVQVALPLSIIVASILFMVYSLIPGVGKRKQILILSYSSCLSGIFLFLFFMFLAITTRWFISINISLIIIAFSLFSSKYLELNMKKVHPIISIILMVNFSLLTYNSFAIIPGLELFGAFLALTVFGGSFYALNHYKMVFNLNEKIPWSVLGVGVTLTVTSLFTILLQSTVTWFMHGFFLTLVSLLFFYRILNDNRYVLWFYIPLPVTFLSSEVMMYIPGFSSLATLVFTLFYAFFVQICVNIAGGIITRIKEMTSKKFISLVDKESNVKWLNVACFTINSVQLPLLISLYTNNALMFLLIMPWLMLGSHTYMKISGLFKEKKFFARYCSMAGFALYSIFSVMATSFLADALAYILVNYARITTIIIAGSILYFLETFIIDRFIYKLYQKKERAVINSGTWLTFSNLMLFSIFYYYSNPFLLMIAFSILNLISIRFIRSIDERFKVPSKKANLVLLNVIFINIALFLASIIALGVEFISQFYTSRLSGLPTVLLFFTLSSFFLFMAYWIYGQEKSSKFINIVSFLMYISFQIFLAWYWIHLSLGSGQVFPFSLSVLFTIEAILCFYPLRSYSRNIKKDDNFKTWIAGRHIMMFLMYIGFSLVGSTAAFFFFTWEEAIWVFHVVLFLMFVIDKASVKEYNDKIEFSFLAYTWAFISNALAYKLFTYYQDVFFLMLLVSILNLLTVHFVSKIDPKYKNGCAKWRTFLLNLMFFNISLYLASIVSISIQSLSIHLYGMSTYLLFFTFFTLFWFLFNLIFNRTLPAVFARKLRLSLYLSFQVFFALYWIDYLFIFNLSMFPGICLLFLIETFFSLHSLRIISWLTASDPSKEMNLVLWQVGRTYLSVLIYCEIALVAFSFLSGVLDVLVSFWISQFVLYFVSLLEVHALRLLKLRDAYSLLSISWLSSANILSYYLYTLHGNIFLLLLSFSFLNLLSVHYVSKIDGRFKKPCEITNLLLINLVFINISLYLSSIITAPISVALPDPVGVSPVILFCMLFSIFMFFLNLPNTKFPSKFKQKFQLLLFISFQSFLAAFWVYLGEIYGGNTILSVSLLLFLEIMLSYYLVHGLNVIVKGLKDSSFLERSHSFLLFCIYLVLTTLSYGLSILGLDALTSLLISQVVLFLLTSLEIHGIRLTSKKWISALHLMSYLIMSFYVFSLNQVFTVNNDVFQLVCVLVFVIMQFYTSHVTTSFLKMAWPEHSLLLKRINRQVKNILGIITYTMLLVLIQGSIRLASIQNQFMAISLTLFFLMILDQGRLKFLSNEISDILRNAAWIVFSAFTINFLVLAIGTIIWTIPFIGLVIIFEFSILIFLSMQYKFVSDRIQPLKKGIIQIVYWILIIWPFFFLDWTTLLSSDYRSQLLPLGISMFVSDTILFGITSADKYGFDDNVRVFFNRLAKFFYICIFTAGCYYVMEMVLHALNTVLNGFIALFVFSLLILLTYYRHKFRAIFFVLSSELCVMIFLLCYTYLAVPWFVDLFIAGLVYVLLFKVVLRGAIDDPVTAFKVNMLYYGIIYAFIVGIFFAFTGLNLIMSLLAIDIFGAILLIFIYYQEKRGVISIKWRLVLSVVFIILIIVTILVAILVAP
ncbi:MAG: hypothetical protein ACFFCS_10755 [Candidatus Hodarchaeota archaeon]